MKRINENTKRGNYFINAYNRSDNFALRHCYDRPSTAKCRAEMDCRYLMDIEGGNGFKIISFNTFGFSCAWRNPDGLRVETPQGSYIIN